MFDIRDFLLNDKDCFCPYCNEPIILGKNKFFIGDKSYIEFSFSCDCARGTCSPFELERVFGIRSSLASNVLINCIIAYREYIENLERIKFRFRQK